MENPYYDQAKRNEVINIITHIIESSPLMINEIKKMGYKDPMYKSLYKQLKLVEPTADHQYNTLTTLMLISICDGGF